MSIIVDRVKVFVSSSLSSLIVNTTGLGLDDDIAVKNEVAGFFELLLLLLSVIAVKNEVAGFFELLLLLLSVLALVFFDEDLGVDFCSRSCRS